MRHSRDQCARVSRTAYSGTTRMRKLGQAVLKGKRSPVAESRCLKNRPLGGIEKGQPLVGSSAYMNVNM